MGAVPLEEMGSSWKLEFRRRLHWSFYRRLILWVSLACVHDEANHRTGVQRSLAGAHALTAYIKRSMPAEITFPATLLSDSHHHVFGGCSRPLHTRTPLCVDRETRPEILPFTRSLSPPHRFHPITENRSEHASDSPTSMDVEWSDLLTPNHSDRKPRNHGARCPGPHTFLAKRVAAGEQVTPGDHL